MLQCKDMRKFVDEFIDGRIIDSLGKYKNLSEMIDHLFECGHCLEDSKRKIKKEIGEEGSERLKNRCLKIPNLTSIQQVIPDLYKTFEEERQKKQAENL